MGWRRTWFERRKPIVEAFLTTVQQCRPIGHDDDQWVWKGKKDLEYIVKDAYNKGMGDNMGEEEEVFHDLQNVKVLHTSQIYAWKVILNRQDKLIKIGIHVENVMYVVCNY